MDRHTYLFSRKGKHKRKAKKMKAAPQGHDQNTLVIGVIVLFAVLAMIAHHTETQQERQVREMQEGIAATLTAIFG